MVTTNTFTSLTALAEVPANNDVLALDDTSAVASKSILAAFLRSAKVDIVIASGSIALNAIQLITLNLGTAIALTVSAAPTAGNILFIHRKGSGAVTHTVQLPLGTTWDGTNRTANFDTDADCLIAVAESTTRFIVLPNTGVTFSA